MENKTTPKKVQALLLALMIGGGGKHTTNLTNKIINCLSSLNESLVAQVDEKDKELAEKVKELADQDQKLADQDKELEGLKAQLAEKDKELESLKAQLAHMSNACPSDQRSSGPVQARPCRLPNGLYGIPAQYADHSEQGHGAQYYYGPPNWICYQYAPNPYGGH